MRSRRRGPARARRATSSLAPCHGLPMPDSDAIAFAQRAAGEPHPWARAWAASAKTLSPDATLRKLDEWLAEDREPRLRRCAVASGVAPDGTRALAVVAVDALADLAPLADARANGPVAHGRRAAAGPGERGGRARARSERGAAARAGVVRRIDAARAVRARSAGRVHGAGAGHDRDRSPARRRGDRVRRRRAPRARASEERVPGEGTTDMTQRRTGRRVASR